MTVPMLTTCVVNKQEIAAEEAEGTLEIICSNNEDQEVPDGKDQNVVKIEYEEDAAESIRKVYKKYKFIFEQNKIVASCLYCPMQMSEPMAIEKLHPTL